MQDFPIPHTPPIRFVKSLISSDVTDAIVVVEFEEIPTLGMLIEAVAQSSSGIHSDGNETKMGFLATLKNIKLLQELTSTKYIVDVHLELKLDSFNSLSFKVLDKQEIVAIGAFTVALQ